MHYMTETAKILMLGDIVADSGLQAVKEKLPALLAESGAVLCVCNGENAASGFGITKENAELLLDAGVDVITSGNHIWEKDGIKELLQSEARLLRPANYPAIAPGQGHIIVQKAGFGFAVVNLQGRENMRPIDSPFDVADSLLDRLSGDYIVIVDFHAESFAEKEALSLYLDGRVSVFAGTHTHVQTADERILPKGCGYIGDLGMCGPVDSVIGVKTGPCIKRNLSQMPIRMESAEGHAMLSGALFTVDRDKRCTEIMRIRI
ncbi:TIGR00282 family metallophosphoesterase [Spirochaetota bacterium]